MLTVSTIMDPINQRCNDGKTGQLVHRVFPKAVALLLCIVLSVSIQAKQKDDQVVMSNGDTFTGEIKGLQNGELQFKSDYMKDPVRLDWARVKTLTSHNHYIISLVDGRRFMGSIEEVESSGPRGPDFQFTGDDNTIEVYPTEVVSIEQKEVKWWNQLTGSVDYGLSFTSDNRSTTSSLGAALAFESAENSVQIATSSQFDSQAKTQNTNRLNFDSQYDRSLSTRWIATGLFGLLKSNQQEVQLRSTFGAGFGQKLVQTNRTKLLAIGGIAYSHESYVPQPGLQPVRDNTELLVGMQASTFRFKTMEISSHLLAFPSLKETGRFRVILQSNARIEIVRNFYWNLQLYENYDSRPPITAPKNDLGVTTSLGWKF